MSEENETIKQTILDILKETFILPQGIYLDRAKGGLLHTLGQISAETASRSTANQQGIAAHVEHTRVYLVALHGYMNGAMGNTDWDTSWQTKIVSDLEWQALLENTKQAYDALVKDLLALDDHDSRLGYGVVIVTHTAYHFGAIRQLMSRKSR